MLASANEGVVLKGASNGMVLVGVSVQLANTVFVYVISSRHS